MKQTVVGFIKTHRLVLLLVAIIGYLVWRQYVGMFLGVGLAPGYTKSAYDTLGSYEMGMGETEVLRADDSFMPVPEAPPTESEPRLVIKDTTLSLLVENVAGVLGQIENLADRFGGFLVNSHLSQPEGPSSGSITVRVPEEKRAEAIAAFRALGVKTVSEQVTGRDVTDQYVDIGARLETLEKTKAKFEEILDEAVRIQDILQVQRELVTLQSQIDSFKGQQQYLEGSAKLSRITIYLSTDELALPFTPDTSWRPEVIFKQAVRSLIVNVRALGNVAIWVAVYSAVLVPVGLLAAVVYRIGKRRVVKSVGEAR